ncbi:MAG: aldehyde dehydrogenase family protein [Lachnospiraceae bacterium]|nr:aldehyde dehydrogenase family protein [Lachnospiraceae bacterium]
MKNEYQLFIDGEWKPQTDGCIREDMEPATGKPLCMVHRAGPEDVEAALQSSLRAFTEWSCVMADRRERILLRAADILESREEEFMEILVRESGKPQHIARGEFAGAVGIFRVAAGECRRHNTEYLPPTKPGQMSMVVRHPLGVILGIAPFNYPLILSVKKLTYAIAAGNSFLLKPSPYTPVTCLLLGEVLSQAGLPAGVLNVLPVSEEGLSSQIAGDPRIRMVSFTGSAKTGHKVALEAARTFKRTAMELGGKNPLILLKDFDVEEAVEIAGNGAFSNQGQLCMATSRILVEAPLYEEFCDKLASYAKGLKVGNPMDSEVKIGPLIHPQQCVFVQGQVDRAVELGAKVIAGGSYDGPFYRPTVLRDVTPQMDIFYEESFAPVTSVIPVKDAAEALQLCNDNLYGLSAAVLTHDLDLAMELGMRIQAGMVHINDMTYLSATTAPSGGVKESGTGREGGRYSMDEYTEVKWITFQTKGKW